MTPITPDDPDYPFRLAVMQLRVAALQAQQTLQQIDAPNPAQTVLAAIRWLSLASRRDFGDTERTADE